MSSRRRVLAVVSRFDAPLPSSTRRASFVTARTARPHSHGLGPDFPNTQHVLRVWFEMCTHDTCQEPCRLEIFAGWPFYIRCRLELKCVRKCFPFASPLRQKLFFPQPSRDRVGTYSTVLEIDVCMPVSSRSLSRVIVSRSGNKCVCNSNLGPISTQPCKHLQEICLKAAARTYRLDSKGLRPCID